VNGIEDDGCRQHDDVPFGIRSAERESGCYQRDPRYVDRSPTNAILEHGA
jgi:hypothetical protein